LAGPWKTRNLRKSKKPTRGSNAGRDELSLFRGFGIILQRGLVRCWMRGIYIQ
jgi:hypothetical protein